MSNASCPYSTTRMIYGPFDLSDASQADTDFFLWRELESCCDYIAFEVSHDGVNFQELARWTDTYKVWEPQDKYYNSYVGDNSVWVAWRFYSDYSISYDGPWVDDIRVWKFVPDPATATPTRTVTRTSTRTVTPTRTPSRTPTRTPTPWSGKVYLPLIANPSPPSKIKSGIHLGSRVFDWNTKRDGSQWDFLYRLRGNAGGIYPAAVVVLSNNLYDIQRTGPGCTVSDATIRSPYLFNYLREAYQNAGTKVIIRINPSPGNFKDAINPAFDHVLITQVGVTPNNLDYCSDPADPNDGKDRGSDYFRTIDDLAREMKAIHDRNAANSWQEFAFEPANEPNKEWYSDWYNPLASPEVNETLAWTDMDAYFFALYEYTHNTYPGVIEYSKINVRFLILWSHCPYETHRQTQTVIRTTPACAQVAQRWQAFHPRSAVGGCHPAQFASLATSSKNQETPSSGQTVTRLPLSPHA